MISVLGWVWFAVVQLICLIATVIGWLILIPFCLARAWETALSPFDSSRSIDRWSWHLLGLIYNNNEDGVSGEHALIWMKDQRVPYMATAWPPWRAYCWTAFRNPAAALTDRFAWEAGPLIQIPFTFRGQSRIFKAGWQRELRGKIPVLSL